MEKKIHVWKALFARVSPKPDVNVTSTTRLTPMFASVPDNPDIAHATALVLDALGNQDILPFLKATFRYSRSLEQKQWATQRMGLLFPANSPAQSSP